MTTPEGALAECLTYAAGPSIIVQTKEGHFMYVYKKQNGTCWYEQANNGTDEKEEEKNDLLDKSFGGQNIIHRIDDNDQEREFMEKHLDYIIDPEVNVKIYL